MRGSSDLRPDAARAAPGARPLGGSAGLGVRKRLGEWHRPREEESLGATESEFKQDDALRLELHAFDDRLEAELLSDMTDGAQHLLALRLDVDALDE